MSTLIEALLCKACLENDHKNCTRIKCFCFAWYKYVPEIHSLDGVK